MNGMRFCLKSLRVILLLVALVHWTGQSTAQTFYLKPGGNDALNGTSDANAWASIDSLNQRLADNTISSGDTVLFKRDGTYRGSLKVHSKSGIVFGAYGTGEAPVLSGAVPVTVWNPVPTAVGGAYRWSADLPFPKAYYAFRDNDRLTLAREPDEGWFHIDSWTESSITDSDIGSTGIDWTDGQAVVRTSNWRYDVVNITSQAGSTIGFSALTLPGNPAPTGNHAWGYFLQDELGALDQEGEWYADTISGGIRVYVLGNSATNPPEGIEVAVYDRCVSVRHSSAINIAGLIIQRADIGVKPYGAGVPVADVAVEDCSFRDVRRGVDDDSDTTSGSNTGQRYEHNSFRDVYDAAIWTSSHNGRVLDNTVVDCGMVPGLGTNGWGYIGISATGDSAIISNNVVRRVGYAGLALNGTGVTANHNYIDSTMAILNDGGGVVIDHSEGLVLEGNIVTHVLGSNESTAPDWPAYAPYTTGIYFGDQHLLNVHAVGNVVTGSSTGIHVDHTHRNTPGYAGNAGNEITANVVFGNSDTQLSITDFSTYRTHDEDEVAFPGLYVPEFNDLYTGNILYGLSSDASCLALNHVHPIAYAGDSGLVDFGDYSGNYYFNPFRSAPIEEHVAYITDFNPDSDLKPKVIPWTLAGWQAKREADAGSQASPLRLNDYRVLSTGSLLDTLSDPISSGSASVWNISGCGSRTAINEGGNYVLRSTDCPWMERIGSAYFEEINSEVIGLYRYSFRMRSDSADAVRLAATYSTADKYGAMKFFGVGTTWSDYEIVVEVKDAPGDDYLLTSFQDMQFGLGARDGSVLYLDSVDVRRCTLDTTYADSVIALHHILRYNCPIADPTDQNVGASFTVPGDPGQCWSDVYGNFYAAGDEVPLDEWASIILFRMDVPTAPLTFNSGVYDVTTDEQWTENWNIAGSVVVHDGATLTIDGAHIGFAESTPSLASNLVVQPGGTLVLRNGATLRNWMGCDASPALWDGVKVLGTGSVSGAGMVVMESGARVTDAYVGILCSDTDPQLPDFTEVGATGGIIQASNALFENNRFDVWMSEHTGYDPLVNGPSSFEDCTFRTTRYLAHPTAVNPLAHVVLRAGHSIALQGCAFSNTNMEQTNPLLWGQGVVAYETRAQVVPDAQDARSRFDRLFMAMDHASWEPSRTVLVDRADFTRCHRGVWSVATDNLRVTNCSFDVPSAGQGTNLYGSTGFIFEENDFVAHGDENSETEVGAIFYSGGPESNLFYNNTFTGFQGTGSGGYSAASIIAGTNAGPTGENGLKLKCNDFRANSYDVAFTLGNGNPDALVGNVQGNNSSGSGDVTAPAGNTFEFDCTEHPARHMHVNDNTNVNSIIYWHHIPQMTVQLVPECRDISLMPSPTTVTYVKEDACPTSPNAGLVVMDAVAGAADADHELDVLEEVYADWSDGGDYPGLLDFVMDSTNSSYEVRNVLMNIAPKVSETIWKAIFFERQPPMNPWHLAQSLLANSPLEQSVIDMMDSLDVEPFYKELVEDGQNGGMSMHTLYKSDIEQFYARKAELLSHAIGRFLHGEEWVNTADLLPALDSLPTVSGEERKLALHLAGDDLTSARVLVDTMLARDPYQSYWLVQDLHLRCREQQVPFGSIDGADRSMLEGIAADPKEPGCPEAMAWLTYLGDSLAHDIELPNTTKRMRSQAEHGQTARANLMLRAYPNPSNGPVYLVYTVPEGVEQTELRMHDAAGRLVYQQRVAPQNGIAELEPDQLATGLHVAVLLCDGIRVGTVTVSRMR